MTEQEIQVEIIRYFGQRRDCRIFRMNTGAVKIEGRYVKYGVPGQPDLFLFANNWFCGIEVKAPGGYQSKQQKAFEAMLKGYGHGYVVAHSLKVAISYIECVCGKIGQHLCEEKI